MRRLLGVTAVLVTSIAVVFGCSSEDGDNNAGTAGVGVGGNAGTGFGVSGNGNGNGNAGASGRGGANACTPAPDDSGCVGEQYAGETVPLDVYIMFDQSCSMACEVERTGPGQCCEVFEESRIHPVRQAVAEFLDDPQSAGIGVGIGYFGYMAIGRTSCEPDDYAEPAVEIARLPGSAATLTSSLNDIVPTGETPTGAAIRGACQYTTGYKRQNPGHQVVILLVTDGIPETPRTGCGATLPDAVAAARECATGSVPINTYVLGVGQALDNLTDIAEAGGTESAYLVEGGDVSKAVLEALKAIRSDATIPCELQIPPAPDGQTLDFDKVNIGVCDASGAPTETYYVENPAACGDKGGWYYSDDQQRIVLCEATCETVTVPGAQLYYSVGCATKPVPVE